MPKTINIPDNATRAEVFKQIFGFELETKDCVNGEYCMARGNCDEGCPLYPEKDCTNSKFDDWWNSPYVLN